MDCAQYYTHTIKTKRRQQYSSIGNSYANNSILFSAKSIHTAEDFVVPIRSQRVDDDDDADVVAAAHAAVAQGYRIKDVLRAGRRAWKTITRCCVRDNIRNCRGKAATISTSSTRCSDAVPCLGASSSPYHKFLIIISVISQLPRLIILSRHLLICRTIS